MGRILIVLVALITMGTAAQATDPITTLAAGSVFGGPTQAMATCYIFNNSNHLLTVTNTKIVRQDGTSLTLTFNNCTTAISAGGTCVFQVNPISAAFTHSCSADVNGLLAGAPGVRGELDFRTAAGVVLATVPLR